MNGNSGKGISFSFSMKPQVKKGPVNVSIGAFKREEKKEERVFLTEVTDKGFKEDEEKKKELIIPLKEPSWKAKAKEEQEPQKVIKSSLPAKKEEAVPDDNLDEARRALLKDLYEEDKEDEGDPNLVIPVAEKLKSTILQNRIPGYDTMDKDAYLKKELNSLPEENDVHSENYSKVRIEDFGRAILRGMGWDGKSNVNSSVYEIKPRPERLGLGAMPLVLDKKQRKSALKKSVLEKAMEKDYTGVKNEWGNNNELRVGLQVGILNGGFRGKQGMIVETPKPNATILKVLIEGEKQVHQMNLEDLTVLSDLTKVQSFNTQFGVAPKEDVQKEKKERSRSRSRSRSHRHHHSSHDHHHHHHSSHRRSHH